MKANVSVRAEIPAHSLEVRLPDGQLVGRVNHERAAELIARGWAEPVGNRTVKYLRMSGSAPQIPQGARGWTGGSRTTRPVLDDWGRRICPGKEWVVEHRPLPR